MKRFLLLLVCAMLCLCLAAVAESDDGIISIRLFETTDVHGYLMDSSSGVEENFQYRMAYFAKIVDNAREELGEDHVILLDGGDIYQGTPVSNMLYGDAMRAAMDVMGYDAVALGNHEFDWDVRAYAADDDGTLPAYVVGDYAGDPDIPVVCGNLYDAATGEAVSFTKEYVIIEKAGLKVCLIGYIPDYTGDIMYAKIAPYTIDGDLEKFSARVDEIVAAEQPDITIIVAHQGPVSVAEAMNPETVDLVVGGHSHSNTAGIADNGVAYLQAGTQLATYGVTTLNYNTADGTVTVDLPETISITDQEHKPLLYDTAENAEYLDADVLAISHAAWDAVADQMSEVLGYVDVSLTRHDSIDGSESTTAGNWLTTLMLEATTDYNTVAAFYNAGGIRCDLALEDGAATRTITVGNVYSIAPFGNKLYIYTLTGAELAQQVLNGFDNPNYGNQFSGIIVNFTKEEIPSETTENSGEGQSAGGPGPRAQYNYTIESITLADGTPVDITDTENAIYNVVTIEYCATLPGSVFETKTSLVEDRDALQDNLAMISALRAESAANNGYLPVDTTAHCIDVSPVTETEAAAE